MSVTEVLKLKKLWIIASWIALILLAYLSLSVSRASAQSTQPPAPAGTASDQACLECHAKSGMETKLPSGEILYLSIDPQTYDHSVHGNQGYACTQCHTNITAYPHPALQAATRRDVTLQLTQVCAQCHQDKFAAAVNDAHTLARQAGNKEAAVCTDCHGAHDITPPAQPRSRIPQTCEKCHSQIFALYQNSVHGAALIGEGNPDVPSCVDCHNAHNVQGPSNTQFRLFSPQICARCHANKALMSKYGINTNVFNTYLSDFHGTTVQLFQAVAPGQETNKPVCIDCHGVHDIKKVSDPNSTVIKDHLLVTCQKCHPGASPNFPSAWLSHYQPSPQHYPIVYYVSQFYRYFIPSVLGVMGLFVVTDAGRRLFNRSKKKSKRPGAMPVVEIKTKPSPLVDQVSTVEASLAASPQTAPETTPEQAPEEKLETPGLEAAPETGGEIGLESSSEQKSEPTKEEGDESSEEQQNE
jgi:predicted CXXCH cytochrome family protein